MSGPGLGWPVNDRQEAAPGRGPAWRSPGFRSASTRATLATVLVGISVLADVVMVGRILQTFGLLDAAAAGTLTSDDANAFDSLTQSLALGGLLLYIVAAISFLAWFSRTVDNVPPLTGHTPERSPRQAIGWWFVPFANLIVPFGIVRDTARQLRLDGGPGVERVLIPWWLCWVGSNVLVNLSSRVPGNTMDDLRVGVQINLVGEVLSVIAGILLVLIIRGMQSSADARARALTQVAPAPALPASAAPAPVDPPMAPPPPPPPPKGPPTA